MELQSDIEAIEKDVSLYEEKNFHTRIEAIDLLEFHIIGQIESLLQKAIEPELTLLKQRAEKLKSELEQIDSNLFKRLRKEILPGNDLKMLVNQYVAINHLEEPGYDNLDIFINGLLTPQPMPEQIKVLEPEMVFYQKTPARVIFELADKVQFSNDDVFVDIGSGLGQVPILVNLLTGITCKGIEFEPSFCDYASNCAAELNLRDINFINVDARKADYSKGTVFFMYTPFSGEMLWDVLELLRKESLQRKITIVTYGPCTSEVAPQNWLTATTPTISIYKPAFFNS